MSAIHKSLVLPLAFVLALFGTVQRLCANQPPVITKEGGKVTIRSPDGTTKVMPAPGGRPPSARPDKEGEKDEDKRKEDEKKDEKDEKKDGDKEEEKPTIIQRPIEPPEPPDPKELELLPDDHGKIRFNFRGQPWPDVLDWLATVSRMSLDWQELPADYLNLVTQDSYTIHEARDLINRHLLARGFTILEKDEVLSVVKTEDINRGLVPRLRPEELADRMPHEFVKVSFTLDWLVAESAVEELEPMLSPNGKLTALTATNRLEAIDAVANLREIFAVLQEEQSVGSQESLVQEFVLQHARATDVHEYLIGLLGMQPKSSSTPRPMSREQMEMMQRQAKMMADMARNQKGGSSKSASKPKPEVHLVVNPRRNSILATAPPDKMVMIAKAVELMDVPIGRDNPLLLNRDRIRVYRLVSLDPETLIETLEESGDLNPSTRLRVDEKSNALIADASFADHLTIHSLVEQLDGSKRQMEVIPLRRLAADYVAGTVAHMMGVDEEDNNKSSSRYYGYYSYRYGSRRSEDEDDDKFRVDADVEGNRLILWASEIELNEVTNLLVKLGEIPSAGGNPDRVRVIDVEPGEQMREFLERVQQAWPSLAPNQLQVPNVKPDSTGETKEPADEETAPPAASTDDKQVQQFPNGNALVRFAQLRQTGAVDEQQASPESTERPESSFPADAQPSIPSTDPPSDVDAAAAQSPSPSLPPQGKPQDISSVQITIGHDGRPVIASQDTAALDLLEELMGQLAPPRKDYKMFPLKYASSFWIRLNLEDFFKEQEDEDKGYRRYYYYDSAPQDKEKRNRLSQRRPLKFIDDVDTNTILVVGADAEQLKTIEELILLWDVPPPTDSESARIGTIYQVRYSKASIIAESVKEVYRDLLSSNDKALQEGKKDERRSPQTTYIFGDGDDEPSRNRTQVYFKGKLSLGVDDVTNTLLVSTEGQNLMDNITKMIEALDEAAKPVANVQVVTLKGGMNAERVREVLDELLSKGTLPGTGATSGQSRPQGPQGPTAGQRSNSPRAGMR